MKHAFVVLILYTVLLLFSSGRPWSGTATCPNECLCYITSRHHFEGPQQTNDVLPSEEEKTVSSSEEPLKSGLCVINAKTELEKFFASLPTDLQALTLMQAPDVQNLTLTKDHLNHFPMLKKIFLQGNTAHQLLSVTEDAFTPLQATLESVTCQFVLFLQNSPKEGAENDSTKFVVVSANDLEPDSAHNLAFEEEIDIIPYEDFVKQTRETQKNETIIVLDEEENLTTFVNFHNLSSIKLYNCSFPSALALDSLTSLRILTIEYSDLQVLPATFEAQSLPNLVNVSLPGNNLIEFQAEELQGLQNVQFLDLSANNITHLSEMSFPALPNLKILDLRQNPLEHVFPNSFEPLSALTRLYLSHSQGQLTIYAHAFQGLSSLQFLSLEGLRLDVLDGSLWQGVERLKHLVVHGEVPRIEADALADLKNLQKLDMRHCRLNHLSMDSFQGLKDLKVLDLSHNELTEIPPGTFDPMTSLKELWLHHNRLAQLPIKVFVNLPAKLIRLDHNPWHCTCTAGFQHWKPTSVNKVIDHGTCLPHIAKSSVCKEKTRYKYDKRAAPKCASPEKFRDWDVFDVLRKGLKCNKDKLPTSRIRKDLAEEWEDILARTEELEKLLKDHDQMDLPIAEAEETSTESVKIDTESELEEITEDELWEPEENGDLSNDITEQTSPPQTLSTGNFGFEVSKPTQVMEQPAPVPNQISKQVDEQNHPEPNSQSISKASKTSEVQKQSTALEDTGLGELMKKIPSVWFQPTLSKKSLKLLMEETKDKMKDALLFKKKAKGL